MKCLDDMMKWSPWVLLPPLYFLGTAAGLWAVYFAAVKNGDIIPLTSPSRQLDNSSIFPPYISVAGNSPPASCIFSQVMNLAAFGGFFIGVLRFLQIKATAGKSWLNIGSVLACSISCFGMTLVGNFQIFSEETIHNTGTLMVFGTGTVFCWMQSFLTLREERKMAVLRFFLSASITASILIHSSMIAVRLHMHGARSQWALVMFLLMFLASFAVELRHCHFDVTCRDGSRRDVVPPIRFSDMQQTDDWSNSNT